MKKGNGVPDRSAVAAAQELFLKVSKGVTAGEYD